MANNVIDFVKAKERKDAMEWIHKMFEELDQQEASCWSKLDQQEEWNRLLTGKDLYDYTQNDDDRK